jgi:hypothetical protein
MRFRPLQGPERAANRRSGDFHFGVGSTHDVPRRPGWSPTSPSGRVSIYADPVVQVRHSGFDHVTIAVTDLEKAMRFFGLLGFHETKATVVSGD